MFEHFFFTTGKTLRRGPTNPHEMSKPKSYPFSGRVLAPCVLGGHGGHSALLQEEHGREAQLQTLLQESTGHETLMVGIVCVVVLGLVSCKETKTSFGSVLLGDKALMGGLMRMCHNACQKFEIRFKVRRISS